MADLGPWKELSIYFAVEIFFSVRELRTAKKKSIILMYNREKFPNMDDALVEKCMEFPRKYLQEEEVREAIEKMGLYFQHMFVPVREDFNNFKFHKEKPKGRPVYLCGNFLGSEDSLHLFPFIEHVIESQIIEEYNAHIMKELLETSIATEKSAFSLDPIENFENFTQILQSRVPDLEIVMWRYSNDFETLATESSTNSEFVFDVDAYDTSSILWQCFEKQEPKAIRNFMRDNSTNQSDREFETLCANLGWRSALLEPVVVRGACRGVIGFFARYAGGIPDIYHPYVDFIKLQSVRCIAESQNINEVLLVKKKLKELTPLMAIGKEVTERMHDIRDNIDKINNLFIQVRNIKRFPERNTAARFGEQGIEFVSKIKSTLSKQLQIYKTAREKKRKTNIGPFVSSLCERIKTEVEFEGVKLKVDADIKEAYVQIQRFYFERAIENLILNAVYFSKQNLSHYNKRSPNHHSSFFVQVLVDCDDESVEIAVIDSGPGVQQEPVDLIFEEGETTKPDGFGIGLPIVKTVVEEHKGFITVKNLEGVGARFSVTLPRMKDSPI